LSQTPGTLPDSSDGPDSADAPDASNVGSEQLAARELLTLQLLARGYSLAQIAALLGDTEKNVSATLASALRALGAATVTEAIATARRRDLIN
jgi:DNA-binding NarL/FixJ family response regulator